MLKNLKVLREAKGLSQRRLAEELGLSQQSINKYENGKTEPDLATLIRIAEFLEVSVDALIRSSDENKISEEPSYRLNERISFVMECFPNLDEFGQDAVARTIAALAKK